MRQLMAGVPPCQVHLYGAHVTRWYEDGSKPYLFLSEKAVLDGTKAIRGGAALNAALSFQPAARLPHPATSTHSCGALQASL